MEVWDEEVADAGADPLGEEGCEEDEENSAWVQTNFGRVGYFIGLSGYHIYLKSSNSVFLNQKKFTVCRSKFESSFIICSFVS